MAGKMTCPIESCGRTFRSRGQSGHWQQVHSEEMTYDQFKELLSAQPQPPSEAEGVVKEQAPAKQPSAKEPPPPEVEAMETPQQVFYAIGRNLGIKEKAAQSAAYYVANNYNMEDASQVWEGLKECTELAPSEKRRWWRTWATRENLHIPLETAEKVTQDAPTASTAAGAAATAQRPKGWVVDEDTGDMAPAREGDEDRTLPYGEARRYAQDIRAKQQLELRGKGKTYLAMGTRVVPVEGDEGMRYLEAVQQAETQWDRDVQRRKEEMDRAQPVSQGVGVGDIGGLIAAMAAAFRSEDHGGMNQQLMDARLREMQTRFEKDMELERERRDQTARQLTETLQAISSRLSDRQSPVDQITEMAKAMDAMAAIRSGEPLDESTAWRQDRRQLIKLARDQFPDFIDAAKEVAVATREEVRSQGAGRRILGICPGCGTAVRFSEASEQVKCPQCGTSFSPEQSRPQRFAAPQPQGKIAPEESRARTDTSETPDEEG